MFIQKKMFWLLALAMVWPKYEYVVHSMFIQKKKRFSNILKTSWLIFIVLGGGASVKGTSVITKCRGHLFRNLLIHQLCHSPLFFSQFICLDGSDSRVMVWLLMEEALLVHGFVVGNSYHMWLVWSNGLTEFLQTLGCLHALGFLLAHHLSHLTLFINLQYGFLVLFNFSSSLWPICRRLLPPWYPEPCLPTDCLYAFLPALRSKPCCRVLSPPDYLPRMGWVAG